MRRLLLQVRFAAQSTPQRGTPPTSNVDSGAGDVTVLADSMPDGSAPPAAHYATTVTENGDGTFDEVGTYQLGDRTFGIAMLAAGVAEPSGVEAYQRGAVAWRITEETTGASGFVTSNVEIDQATGNGDDRHIVRLYLP